MYFVLVLEGKVIAQTKLIRARSLKEAENIKLFYEETCDFFFEKSKLTEITREEYFNRKKDWHLRNCVA